MQTRSRPEGFKSSPAPTCLHRSLPGAKTLLYSGPGTPIRQHEHLRPFICLVMNGRGNDVDDRGDVQQVGPQTLSFSPIGTRHSHNFTTERISTLCTEFS